MQEIVLELPGYSRICFEQIVYMNFSALIFYFILIGLSPIMQSEIRFYSAISGTTNLAYHRRFLPADNHGCAVLVLN